MVCDSQAGGGKANYERSKSMSDYIKREDALTAIAGLLNVVEQIDGADVVEVVRCKDCIYNDSGWCGSQEYGTRHVEDNDYCSYGERKDNE